MDFLIEVAGLKVKDFTLVKGNVLMCEVRIIGKGNKERPVKPVLVGGKGRYLHEWLPLDAAQEALCSATSPGLVKALGQKGSCREKMLA